MNDSANFYATIAALGWFIVVVDLVIIQCFRAQRDIAERKARAFDLACQQAMRTCEQMRREKEKRR